MLEAERLAGTLIRNGCKPSCLPSRLNVEVLVTYLREMLRGSRDREEKVRGYRGGYLPGLRREIERGLREGSITGVVSTNALELGIDIGALEACVICGYPGTIASTWQQAGRAGRRSGVSAAFLVASSSPLDQYIINNPEYFFGKSPENGMINPDNLVILYNHMKCAAFDFRSKTAKNSALKLRRKFYPIWKRRGWYGMWATGGTGCPMCSRRRYKP